MQGKNKYSMINPMSIPTSMKCVCRRCGHSWIKRIEGRPTQCPGCHEQSWDTPAGLVKPGPKPKLKKAVKKGKGTK